jgi:WD40 repeat protein
MLYRGHSSYVNCGIITKDGQYVMTGSSDGTCRLWDFHTTEVIEIFR